jgi:hypothetical protein
LEVTAVGKTPGEIARQFLEQFGTEALYEAQCLAVLHRGHRGEGLYAAVLAEVRRLLGAAEPCLLVPAG